MINTFTYLKSDLYKFKMPEHKGKHFEIDILKGGHTLCNSLQAVASTGDRKTNIADFHTLAVNRLQAAVLNIR